MTTTTKSPNMTLSLARQAGLRITATSVVFIVKITVDESDEYRVGYVEPTRRLPVCIAHRARTTLRPPFDMDDMPIRLEGEYRQSADGRVREWHGRASAYELQQMMVWSSYKAIRCLKTEDDVVDGFGLREALALEGENPDHWPDERRACITRRAVNGGLNRSS